MVGIAAHPVANAHDFWVQPAQYWVQPGDVVPVTLQVGDEPSQQRSNIPLRRITRFASIAPTGGSTDRSGDLRLRGPEHDGELRFREQGTHIVILETDNRAQSHLPADRFNAYLLEEGLTPAIEHRQRTGRTGAAGLERYSRRTKAIVQVGPSVSGDTSIARPVGLSLELVPETNPYARSRPAQLVVRVVHEGQALPGALAKLIDLQRRLVVVEEQRSDANGRVRFAMPDSGAWLVSVTWTQPLPASEGFDFETTFSTLSFGFAADRDDGSKGIGRNTRALWR